MFILYDLDPAHMELAADAATRFRQSADAGNDVGQMRLGRAYSLGLGVSKDAALAQQWLRRAAAQGNTEAKEFLKRIYNIDQ
jgi:TPR repeat protein